MRWAWLPVAVVVVAGLFPFLHKKTSELPVYTTGAVRMLGGEEVYRRDDAKPFSYPPFFAVPFVPLAMLPESAHRTVWYFANVAMLLLAVAALRAILRPALASVGERGPKHAWLWIGIAALSVRHVLAVFENQSHDLVILLVVTLIAFVWGRGSPLLAGACAGIGAACKATPLLFAAPLVAQRSWRGFTALVAVLIGCTLFPDVVFPRDDGRLWVVRYYTTMIRGIGVGSTAAQEGVWVPAGYLNQSLAGTLYRLTTVVAESGPFVKNVALVDLGANARRAVTLAAQLVVLALVAWPSRHRPPRDLAPAELALRRLGDTALVVCGMVLLSPMSSKSHFCVLILPAAFCWFDFLYRRRDPLALVLLALFLVAGTLTTKGLTGSVLGEELLARGAVTWGALAALGATARVCVTRRRAPTAGLAGPTGAR